MAFITITKEHAEKNPKAFADHVGETVDLGKFRTMERNGSAVKKDETASAPAPRKTAARKSTRKASSKKAK